jgi:hypothetical protein
MIFLYNTCKYRVTFTCVCFYRGDVSGEVLTDWYEYRAKEIEKLSRQADCALDLVKLAIERQVQVCNKDLT